jgi:AraC family transcriptional regulator
MSKDNFAPHGSINSTPPPMTGSNIVWSSGQAWRGLVIEKHLPGGKNSLELKSAADGLAIRLSSARPAKNIIKKNDRINRPANICFFPAGLLLARPCLHHPGEVLLLTLAPDVVRRAARELRVNFKNCFTAQHQIRDAQVEYIGMALRTEAESGYLSGRLYGESLGMALSVHLLSKYSVAAPDPAVHKGGMTPANLRRVIEYIHDNLTEDIGLNTLARVANLSPFRFAHNFKQATGLSPHQYVIRERLERAKKMLRETDLTVTTIAYAVGCGSPSRFTLLFRRAHGVIPSVYRASFR